MDIISRARTYIKKFITSQDSLARIKVLTICVVVAVLVTAGVLFCKHSNESNAKKNTALTTSQTTPQQTATSTTQAQQTAVQYLYIKEWGVQLPLADSIKDAYYVVSTSSSKDLDGLPSTVWLGLTSLTDPSCNPANNNAGKTSAVGAILRVPPDYTDPVSPYRLYTQKYPNGVTIGSYYYAYQSWINATSCSQKTTIQTADSAFGVAAKGIISATSMTN